MLIHQSTLRCTLSIFELLVLLRSDSRVGDKPTGLDTVDLAHLLLVRGGIACHKTVSLACARTVDVGDSFTMAYTQAATKFTSSGFTYRAMQGMGRLMRHHDTSLCLPRDSCNSCVRAQAALISTRGYVSLFAAESISRWGRPGESMQER